MTASTISISDKARDKLAFMAKGSDQFLRVKVVGGGCSGLTYSATFDTQRKTEDQVVYSNDGVTVVSDNESIQYLNGLEIDYSDDLIKSGFRFINKNAKKTCGCGSSFSM